LVSYKPSEDVLRIIEDSKAFTFNKDYRTRDRILGLNAEWGKDNSGGIARFEDLNVKTFETLLLEKYIDPEGSQNESPSAKEIFYFMVKYPQVLAYGYAVSPDRDDYRTTIEGLFVPSSEVTPQLKKDFEEFCEDADEIETDSDLYSWWD
jgi:hypothetical protein